MLVRAPSIQRGKLPARALRPDDQAVGDVCRHLQAVAVSGPELAQAGDHGRVVGDNEGVERFSEALLREVQGRDDRRPLVRDEILRVILHDRIGVGME
jgi:hypothetical protein